VRFGHDENGSGDIVREVVVAGALRTAIGKRNGALAGVHPSDLLGPVQMAVLARSGLDPGLVGQVVGGCPNQGGAQGGNISRIAWLAHGGAVEVGGSTVNSACGSSQQALNLAYALIASGVEDIVLACGVENMSLVPMGAAVFDCANAGHGVPTTPRYEERFAFTSQFEGAERIARKYGIGREEADEFGLTSQLRARHALEAGRFETQIVPIDVDERQEGSSETRAFLVDEVPRETSLEALAALNPVAGEGGIHTAGTSSQIADGAAAVLLMSAERAAELQVKPHARILQTCLVGCDPVLMLEGPIPVTERFLKRQGMTIDDIDVIEINEAFASVVLAWQRVFDVDMNRVNPNGGAIALGHPLGATGCLLVAKAVHELERSDKEAALVTMCCGTGLGTGTLLERL
jgi:acetyl-CoA C-acetyltransferase